MGRNGEGEGGKGGKRERERGRDEGSRGKYFDKHISIKSPHYNCQGKQITVSVCKQYDHKYYTLSVCIYMYNVLTVSERRATFSLSCLILGTMILRATWGLEGWREGGEREGRRREGGRERGREREGGEREGMRGEGGGRGEGEGREGGREGGEREREEREGEREGGREGEGEREGMRREGGRVREEGRRGEILV